MGDLSPHFSRKEFADSSGHLIGPSVRLLCILENLRGQVGRPIRIISGYRSRAHQEEVNPGVVGFHPLGRAADIPQGIARPQQALDAGATGVGVRNGWVVHVDDRPGIPVTFPDP